MGEEKRLKDDEQLTRITSEKMRDLLKVYFIAGTPNCRKDIVEVVQEAIDGGITLFQYREKGKGALIGEEKYATAKSIQHLCQQRGIPFIVNDDIELAISLHADGVHVGQEDESVESVRKKIGDKILGVSVHTLEEAEAALAQGADYFGIGPIFPTQTKEDAKAVQGTVLVQDLKAKGINMPIVGIGGITVENAHMVIQAGADGVSVISTISHAKSVIECTKKLKNEVLQAKAK
ncbi:thiamine phosphate synthase [Microbacteriaceae bacterium 4G12]